MTSKSADAQQMVNRMVNEVASSTEVQRKRDLVRFLGDQGEPRLVVDVGANVGQFAKEILSAVDCEIYCFEPGHAAFAALEALARSEPRIRPFRFAVDIANSTRDFFVSESDVGSSLLPPIKGQTSKWASNIATEKVNTVRLDTFIKANGLSAIDLLKTDAQGTDGRVLTSAGDFLNPKHIKAVLVELNLHTFYDGQDTLASIIDLLTEAGYFLAGFYPNMNRNGWLWWADGLFLPRAAPFAT